MMLGYLLARAGVPTVVLEKHADFLRDFRGDTVHPSTMRIMDELGLLDAFLRRPHQRLKAVAGVFGERRVQLGDFSGLPERYAFIAMMPQWEFLDFLAGEAKKLPAFSLRMRAEVTGLVTAPDGRIAGVRGRSAESEFELGADCTIGCDGRHSTVRAAAGLAVEDVGAPIDVLWFRVGRDPGNEDAALARVAPGHFVVTSIAATTGSAPSSFPRAAPRRCSDSRSRCSARRWSRRRRCCRRTSATCAPGATSSC